MPKQLTTPGAKCPMGCGGCADAQPDTPPPGSPSGWRMAGWSAGVFWFPIVAAIAGARMAGDDRTGQAAGGLAGLLFGAALARGVYLVARGSRTTRGHDS